MIYELNIQTYKNGSVKFDDFEAELDLAATIKANKLIDAWEKENNDLSYRWYLNEKKTGRELAV